LSAGELIAHLNATERTILGRADKLLQKPPKSVPFYKRFHVPMMIVEARVIRRKAPRAKPPKSVPFYKRFHVPMMIVEARVIRRKAPRAVEPQTVNEKEEMLAELRGVRERTLAFIEETRGRDLSKYNMPHPFLGTLNAYDWLQFVASHEIRHMKQMQEIADSIPKTVTRLHK